MPVEDIVDNPRVLVLPAAAYGILVRLLVHFWRSECRPLPKAAHELQSIARAHRPTWRIWSNEILAILDELKPVFIKDKARRDNMFETLRIWRDRANAGSRAKKLESRAPAALQTIPEMLTPKRRQDKRAESIAARVLNEPAGFLD